MAMMRLWRGRPRGLSELPAEVRESKLYGVEPWYLDRALLSRSGTWLRLEFEDLGGAHYWHRLPDGTWQYSQASPAVADLLDPADLDKLQNPANPGLPPA